MLPEKSAAVSDPFRTSAPRTVLLRMSRLRTVLSTMSTLRTPLSRRSTLRIVLFLMAALVIILPAMAAVELGPTMTRVAVAAMPIAIAVRALRASGSFTAACHSDLGNGFQPMVPIFLLVPNAQIVPSWGTRRC
jgi:hypothetical protein